MTNLTRWDPFPSMPVIDNLMPPQIPSDRALTDDELEDALIQALLSPGGRFHGLQGGAQVLDLLGVPDLRQIQDANGGSDVFDLRVLAVLWRWVGVGLLVSRGPAFHLAPGANELLAARADEAEVILHRSGLARRLQERCPNLDSVTESYARMSQESFLAGHYQAAAVMLGVSSKAAVLHFVPRCERVLKELGIKPRKCRNDSAVELLRWIEDTVEQHRKALVEAVQGVGGENWIDDLPGLLGIAKGIRLTRNEAGQPTPHIVDRDECRNMIGLFPRLAEALFVSAEAFDRVVAGSSQKAP